MKTESIELHMYTHYQERCGGQKVVRFGRLDILSHVGVENYHGVLTLVNFGKRENSRAWLGSRLVGLQSLGACGVGEAGNLWFDKAVDFWVWGSWRFVVW